MQATMRTSTVNNGITQQQGLSSKVSVAPAFKACRIAGVRQARSSAVVVRAARGPNLNFPGKAKASYDKNAYRTNPVQSAFTRRREIFVGRTAMTGFISAVIGELLTGRGVIGQLNLETSLPPFALKGIIAAIVGFNLVTALLPNATFSQENQQDVRKRPAGGVQKPNKRNFAQQPVETLGVSKGFGFTKKNELFVGRMAMLGFAADLIGEQLTGGKGPLQQIGLGTGQPFNPELASFGLAVWIGFFAVAAVGFASLQSPKFAGETEGDEDVY